MPRWPTPNKRRATSVLVGRRVTLRVLTGSDFEAWRMVRRRSADWLEPWEPMKQPAQGDPVEDRGAFVARCAARLREIETGAGYGFGLFCADGYAGEINLSNIRRGPAQTALLGYWVDQTLAGRGLVPEGVVLALRFAFEDLGLHRVEAGVLPRNAASLRVMEKLGLTDEGITRGMLEINGRWEDHRRFAMLAEDWADRREALLTDWVW
ncbi:MAG: GNAT family protein [Microthrixaceae bacterium]